MSEQSITHSETENWQKLSPVAVAFFVIEFTLKFVKEYMINLAPALAIFVTQVEDKLDWAITIVAVLLVLLLVFSFLYYLNYRFRIAGDEILVRKGVFSKERITLNFGRVQNVNIATPFYFSPFKLVNCVFDSAGSAQKEINLPGIKLELASNIRQQIFTHREHKEASVLDSSEAPSATNQEAYLTLSNKESAKFGLASPTALILVAFLAPFSEHISTYIETNLVPVLLPILESFLGTSELGKSSVVLLLLVSAFVLVIALSTLMALIQFYNFQLFDEGPKFKRISGLFERRQMSLSKHRVQSISIKQNWVFRLLKRVTVTFHQLAPETGGQRKGNQTFLIPTLTHEQCPDIIHRTFDFDETTDFDFSSISKRYITRMFTVFWLVPLIILGSGLSLINHDISWLGLVGLALIGLPIIILKHRRYGLWYNDEFAAIRTGLIGFKTHVLPIYKVQKITSSQTPYMRKHGLVSLDLQMAFGTISLPYLPIETAYRFVDFVAYKVEKSEKSWL